jgi:hypothetical protein
MMHDRRAWIGELEFELARSFRFDGTPCEVAERGSRLYAAEVLPVIKAWTTGVTARAAN